MRKIKILNQAQTEVYELDKNGIYISSLSGLGASFKVEDDIASNNFEDIKLDLIFSEDSYQKYSTFLSFLTAGYLVLNYDNGHVNLNRKVLLKQAPLSQITEYKVLNESFVFQPLSAWYQEFNTQITADLESEIDLTGYYDDSTYLKGTFDIDDNIDFELKVNEDVLEIDITGIGLKTIEVDGYDKVIRGYDSNNNVVNLYSKVSLDEGKKVFLLLEANKKNNIKCNYSGTITYRKKWFYAKG